MTTIENELSVAKRFHALVSIYDRRPAMARRNILPILIRFTRSIDRELRFIAVDCILLLTKHPQSCAALRKYAVLQSAMEDLLKDTDLDDPELYTLVSLVLQQLAAPPISDATPPDSRLSSLSMPEGDSTLSASPEPTPDRPFALSSGAFTPENSPDVVINDDLHRWAGGLASAAGPDTGSGLPASMAGAGPLGAAVACRLPPPIHALQQQAENHPRPPGHEEAEENVGLGTRRGPLTDCPTSIADVARHPPSESSLFYQNTKRDGAGLDSPHMVTFYVPHLYPRTNTAILEHLLQTIKGVISYHLYPAQHQIRVYMICKPQLVQQALEQQTALRSTILQDELLLLDTSCAPSSMKFHRGPPGRGRWGKQGTIASSLAAKAEFLRRKVKGGEKLVTPDSPHSVLASSSSGVRLLLDPTETRQASWFHLARTFILELLLTVRVYASTSRSTIEARVQWQRDCLALEQEVDNIGGASTKHGEWWGKIIARMW